MEYKVIAIESGKAIEERYYGFALNTIIKNLQNRPELKNVYIIDDNNNVVYMSKDEIYRKSLYNALVALNELKSINYTEYKYFDKEYVKALLDACDYVYRGLTFYS